MKIINIKVKEIKPYEQNPRFNDHAVEKVANSIKEFGIKQPLVVDENNVLIVGHTRLKAMQKLGIEEAPCIVASDLTADQARAYRLADNKTNELAEWDFELLIPELAEIEFDMKEFGFDEFDSFKDLDYEAVDVEDEAETKEIYSKDEIVDEAFEYYRKRGFPYPEMQIFEMKQEINKLSAIEGDRLKRAKTGGVIADVYNKHRFDCSAINMKSPAEAFEIDKDLRKSIAMDYPNIKSNSISFIQLVNGTQSCSNFRPAFCKYILDKYGKDKDIFLDPCMGFGGRMIGFFASDYKEYIATDPSTRSFEANSRMKDDLLPKNKSATLYNECFEDLDLSVYEEKVDIVFTSPPYFNKEEYADEETQSAVRYSDYELWKEGFLDPLIAKSYKVLKNKRYFILNIEDTNIGNERYNLVTDTIALAQKTGFKFEGREEFVMQTRTMKIDNEVVNQQGKESVLVFLKE